MVSSKIQKETRMHSSRMRTACSLTVSRGICWGACAHMPPATHAPPPCTPATMHAPHHTCPPATHGPPATHAPCHAHPQPHMPPAMHAPHAFPHLQCMPPCHTAMHTPPAMNDPRHACPPHPHQTIKGNLDFLTI